MICVLAASTGILVHAKFVMAPQLLFSINIEEVKSLSQQADFTPAQRAFVELLIDQSRIYSAFFSDYATSLAILNTAALVWSCGIFLLQWRKVSINDS